MAYISFQPKDYFNTKLYTGTGASNSVDVGFQTDFTWIKDRDSTAYHYLYDTVRGAGKAMYSNDTLSEATNINNLASFDASGFTVGTGGGVNASGNDFASWNWLAGGTASSNTDGSITSSVSANTTSGFSIVSYTGTGANATVGHGLGVAPKFIIYKQRNTARNWYVFTDVIDGSYDNLYLNLTDAKTDRSITLPTSSVFSLSSSNEHNESSGTYIAYCFAEKKGYSKFGSYTGNGSTDGPFVYTGFKPAMVITKNVSSVQGWYLLDNKRNPSNDMGKTLFPHDSAAEFDYGVNPSNFDMLSNGFKLRQAGANNVSGQTIIYMAFAENPLVGTNNIPATAR